MESCTASVPACIATCRAKLDALTAAVFDALSTCTEFKCNATGVLLNHSFQCLRALLAADPALFQALDLFSVLYSNDVSMNLTATLQPGLLEGLSLAFFVDHSTSTLVCLRC